ICHEHATFHELELGAIVTKLLSRHGGAAVELVGKPNGGKAILHGHDREQFEPSGRQLDRPALVGLHDAVLLSAVRKHAVALGLETWNITRAHGAIHPSAGTGSHVIVAVEGSHDAAPIV